MSAISPTSAALIEERVSWLDVEMEAAFASASPDLDLYQWSRYHLGWLSEGLETLSPVDRRKHGGKRLRGVLTLLACEALGGSGINAAPGGAAVELIHNFSLVHDDVEDNDQERRHRPTVWKLWGVPHAINVGSNMQSMVNVAALRLAKRYPADTVVSALGVLTDGIVRMTEGQFLDMAGEDAAEISRERYFRMTGGKTAALTEVALRLGALLGCDDEARIEAMARFGRDFGLAFQCRDDFLGIWGDPALTGKPAGNDLIQGKRSLPVVEAMAAAPAGTEAGGRLRAVLEARDVAASLLEMEALGTLEAVRVQVEHYTHSALNALHQALNGAAGNPASGVAIRQIAEYALGREH